VSPTPQEQEGKRRKPKSKRTKTRKAGPLWCPWGHQRGRNSAWLHPCFLLFQRNADCRTIGVLILTGRSEVRNLDLVVNPEDIAENRFCDGPGSVEVRRPEPTEAMGHPTASASTCNRWEWSYLRPSSSDPQNPENTRSTSPLLVRHPKSHLVS